MYTEEVVKFANAVDIDPTWLISHIDKFITQGVSEIETEKLNCLTKWKVAYLNECIIAKKPLADVLIEWNEIADIVQKNKDAFDRIDNPLACMMANHLVDQVEMYYEIVKMVKKSDKPFAIALINRLLDKYSTYKVLDVDDYTIEADEGYKERMKNVLRLLLADD